MKKLLIFLSTLFFWCNISLAENNIGKGELKFDGALVDYFMDYLKTPPGESPLLFLVSISEGRWNYATYWYCPEGSCSHLGIKSAIKKCNLLARKKYDENSTCFVFAKRRQIVWDNGINPKKRKTSTVNSRWSREEVIEKLTELGFYGGSVQKKVEKKKEKPKKVEKKKEPKKVVKNYELKGKRSIALSWEGYEDLIAGTVEFDEADYRGTLNLPLPNNDGTCDGTYSLQEGGKGTWQIACTNNMGAAGTLKWIKDGGVTGIGRDHNDKKVKFTVSKQS